MKLALIVDNTRIQSFELRDGKSYKLNSDDEYSFPHSIKNECHIGFWSYPKLLGDGMFIHIDNNELPKLDLDVIIVSLELDNWKDSLFRIRNAYSNAIVLGTIKEPSQTKLEFLNSCDKVALQYSKFNIPVSKEIFWLPQPIDTDYIYNNFFNEAKKIQMFCYEHHVHSRRGLTKDFCTYMNYKYNIPIVSAVTNSNNNNQWRDFILSWRDSLFHINMDPEYQFGQQAIQCAALGTLNIGGLNDSHFHLYPSTSTNDFSILEQEIVKCLNDQPYIESLIISAWDNVNKLYSLNAVKQILIKNIK